MISDCRQTSPRMEKISVSFHEVCSWHLGGIQTQEILTRTTPVVAKIGYLELLILAHIYAERLANNSSAAAVFESRLLNKSRLQTSGSPLIRFSSS